MYVNKMASPLPRLEVDSVENNGIEKENKNDFALDLDMYEIDDKEFDIPPVENLPTLESILNAPDDEDDGQITQENFITAETPGTQLHDDQGETGSLSSQDGILGDRPKKKYKKSVRYEKHGAVLRHVILKNISAQMASAADRVDAGLPTALAVSSLIAIGTSHGLVLVFDPKQVLKWCLGSTAVGAQFGAVSALSFNIDCTRLLCGFARGQITMWDLTNGKLLRTVTDAHPPGTAILHVKFTDDRTVAVTSDSGGSVFELEFKRLIGVRTCESQCLFSGSRGEVCAIEPLCMQQSVQDHPMKDVIILAMASLSKVLVVVIKPQLKVHYIHPLAGDPATLPLLSWQFVVIQVSDSNRVIDPVLAFARDQTIYFVQVICQSLDDIKVSPLQKTELPYKLLAITWINSRTMVIIDTSERAHLVDVRSEEEVEVVDLAEVQLAYSTSFYKSLATGGNVSKALAYAGERACYQSIVTFNNQLVLLGTKGIHVLTLRSWSERIDLLLKFDRYQEALSLAQSFYDGKAKAVVGLHGSSQKRKDTVGKLIMTLLNKYVDLSMTTFCPSHGKVQELELYYRDVVTTCVDHCLALGNVEFLFDKIYERFSEDSIAKATYLECLEPYILNDTLTSVTPFVMKDFVGHYETRGLLSSVEACIVHMDIASLDIHQVVSLCWAHGLYDAILYIYNRGMNDYTTPLEELLARLSAIVATGKQLTFEQVQLGNKILVYISCCLAGRAYPLGDIPDNLIGQVKEQVSHCITILHTANHSDEEPAYPHLRALIQFDTREFFNVLSLAFEDPDFQAMKKQRIVDILLLLMVESVGFSPPQVGILFTFLARQMAKPNNNIIVKRVLFEQVLESLCASGEESRHEERQQALLELLHAGGLDHFDEGRLVSLADLAGFYRVCEMLHEKKREFYRILSCYWRDNARQQQVFIYIQRILGDKTLSVDEKAKVKEEALKNLEHFVKIDARRTAKLVLIGFSTSPSGALDQLANKEDTMYEFLQGVFEYVENSSTGEDDSRKPVKLEPEIYEKYLELMCRKASSETVVAFLKSNVGYRLDQSLDICRRYGLREPIAHLLEKSGDLNGAFELTLELLQIKLESWLHSENEFTEAEAAISVVIELLKRNSFKLEHSQRESFWFILLENILEKQRKVDAGDTIKIDDIKLMTRQIINAMMAFVPLSLVLQKIIADPAYESGKFGEMKDLLLGMLDTCNYEKTLLRTCANLVNHDLHCQLSALTVAASRGIALKSNVCSICCKPINSLRDRDMAICFQCGHGFHYMCLVNVRSVGSSAGGNEKKWLCCICNKIRQDATETNVRVQRPTVASPVANVATSPKGSGESDVSLTPAQITAMDNLRRNQKCQSRLNILNELAQHDRGSNAVQARYQPHSRESILHNEQFALRLAAPPPPT